MGVLMLGVRATLEAFPTAAVASAATLIQAVFVHPASWGAMRMITGLCFASI
jgi:hypothetical protein